MQTIKRKDLLELYGKYHCPQWKETIEKYLKVSAFQGDDYDVKIEPGDIDKAIKMATEEQRKDLEKLIKLDAPFNATMLIEGQFMSVNLGQIAFIGALEGDQLLYVYKHNKFAVYKRHAHGDKDKYGELCPPGTVIYQIPEDLRDKK